jgi:hypothetical protein
VRAGHRACSVRTVHAYPSDLKTESRIILINIICDVRSLYILNSNVHQHAVIISERFIVSRAGAAHVRVRARRACTSAARSYDTYRYNVA